MNRFTSALYDKGNEKRQQELRNGSHEDNKNKCDVCGIRIKDKEKFRDCPHCGTMLP